MRILIVEDNPDVADVLAELLRIEGYDDVRVAADGPSGLAEVRSRVPDTVLCDVGLPGQIDGLEFARRCRTDPALQSAYLVAISGFGGADDRQRALDAGFNELLAKPIRFDALIDCVRRARKDT